MSNIINLSIPPSAKVTVAVGDRITYKTTIAKTGESREIETIHLAKLLGVPNNQISKHLRKMVGEKVSSGDILAEKTGLFSSSKVRSPLNGKIAEMDLSLGTLSLVKYSREVREDLVSPIEGNVVGIGRSAIEIETESHLFKGIKGEGKSVIGDLRYIDSPQVGILDFHDDIENSIVMCGSAGEATLIKFSVLGVLGVILQKVSANITLPWVQVDAHIFGKLSHFAGKKIWLNPENKQIVVLE